MIKRSILKGILALGLLASCWVGVSYYHGKIVSEKLSYFLKQANTLSSIQLSLDTIENHLFYSTSQLKLKYPQYHLDISYDLKIAHGPISILNKKLFMGFGSVLVKMPNDVQALKGYGAKEHIGFEMISKLSYTGAVETELMSPPKRILYQGEYFSPMDRFEPVEIFFNWGGLNGIIEHASDWNSHVLNEMTFKWNRQYSHVQNPFASVDEVVIKAILYREKEMSIAMELKNYDHKSGINAPSIDIYLSYSMDKPEQITVNAEGQLIAFKNSQGVKFELDTMIKTPDLFVTPHGINDEKNYLIDGLIKRLFNNNLSIAINRLKIIRQQDVLQAKGQVQLDHYDYLAYSFTQLINSLVLDLDVSVPETMEENITFMLDALINRYQHKNYAKMTKKERDDFTEVIHNTLRDKRVTHQKGQFDFKFKLDKGTFDLVG